MSDTLIYTDGACSGNPGPGGWGAILVLPHSEVLELGGFEANTTNNRMELKAVLEALKQLKQPQGNVHICTDSVYVIRGITQWIFNWKRNGWKNSGGQEVLNQDIWSELDDAVFRAKKSANLYWRYVPGHQGIAGNERCDRIAVAYSKGEAPALYRGPLKQYSYDVGSIPQHHPLPEMRSSSKSSPAPVFYLSYVDGVLLKHTSWPECQNRVKGRSGAKFKKAQSDSEAREILKSWGLNPESYETL